MTDLATTAPARLATRLAFFVAGFATACWAPLIPFAKANTGADEGVFGLLLLCLGLGSLIAMPVTGWMSSRHGAWRMVLLGGFGMTVVLPMLPLAGHPLLLGVTLAFFGAALGTLDVSMNVHGAEVERIEARPLMSGFHAQFSIGTFVGAAFVTGLLTLGVRPDLAALLSALVAFGLMVPVVGRLRRTRSASAEPLAWPRGVVWLLAGLTAVAFLVEGAILDWGALLIIDRALTAPPSAGIGFMIFSVAMVIARLTGDRMVALIGPLRMLVLGGLVTLAGLAVVLVPKAPVLALSGFALVGLGAGNVVPVLFSLAGRQTAMPAELAITSVTITGYAGILLGPALLGFAADATDLPTAFWILFVLMAAVPLLAARATRA